MFFLVLAFILIIGGVGAAVLVPYIEKLPVYQGRTSTFDTSLITTETVLDGDNKLSLMSEDNCKLTFSSTDTNVFVECPDIINKIGNKNKIIIPAKVLDELDKLKLKPETDKQKLNKASRNIAEAFTKNFSKMEAADVSLLPVGFDSKTPDCMILSVALKHKDENVIFLTSDLNLQARASGLEIKTKSLREFLKNN